MFCANSGRITAIKKPVNAITHAGAMKVKSSYKTSILAEGDPCARLQGTSEPVKKALSRHWRLERLILGSLMDIAGLEVRNIELVVRRPRRLFRIVCNINHNASPF
jgi:hypothetical protein